MRSRSLEQDIENAKQVVEAAHKQEVQLGRQEQAPGMYQAGDLKTGLSNRELEVLRLVAAGLSNALVAEKLVLSTYSVNSYLSSIYSELEVVSRTEAIRYYALGHKLLA